MMTNRRKLINFSAMVIKCVQCEKEFEVSEAEREFYEENGQKIPTCCKSCRKMNRIRKNDAVVPGSRERQQNRRTVIKAVPATVLMLMIAGTFIFLGYVRGGQQDNQSPAVLEAVMFHSEDELLEKYEKYGRKMEYNSAEEYLAGANSVIRNPEAVHKKDKDNEVDFFYIKDTGDLVTVSADGYIDDFYRPRKEELPKILK